MQAYDQGQSKLGFSLGQQQDYNEQSLETFPRDITSLSNLKFFPTVDYQKFQRHNYTVLVSRVLVEHLDCFSALKDVCGCVPYSHKYSNEMAKKSEVVSYICFLWVLFVGLCFCKGFQSFPLSYLLFNVM